MKNGGVPRGRGSKMGKRSGERVSHSAPSSSQGLEDLYGESPFEGTGAVERQTRLALELCDKDADVFSEDSSVSVDSQDPKPFFAGRKLEAIVDPAPPFYNAEVGSRSTLFAFNRNKHFCEPLVTFGRLEFIVEYLTTEAGKKYILAFLCYYHDVASADDIVRVLYELAANAVPTNSRVVIPTKKDLRCVYREQSCDIPPANGPPLSNTGITVACATLAPTGASLNADSGGNTAEQIPETEAKKNGSGQEVVAASSSAQPKTSRDSVSSTVRVVNSVSFFSALYGRIGFPTERDHRGVAEVLEAFVKDFNGMDELSESGMEQLRQLCAKLGKYANGVAARMNDASGKRLAAKRLSEQKQSGHTQESLKNSGQETGRRQRFRARFKSRMNSQTRLSDLLRKLNCSFSDFVMAEKRELGRKIGAFKQRVFEHRAKSLGEFYKYTETQVAIVLTRDLYEIYSRIGPKEMLTLEARQSSANVQQMIDMFNRYSWWCVHWVLTGMMDNSGKDKQPEDVSDRVNRLVYMLKVAEECRRLNSFHVFFGLMGGLCQPQLMWVWGFAKEKDKMLFNNLKRAVSPNNDYRVYRADLSKCADDTYIPFLGYTTKVLFTFEKQIKAFSTDYPDLIDFGRLISMFATVEEFLDGRKTASKSSNFAMFRGGKNESPKTPSRKGTKRLAKVLHKQLDECKTSEQLDEISQEQQDTMRTVLLDSLKTSGFL